MAKKIDVIEVPVVDPMAERAKIKANVDKVLREKIDAIVKDFEGHREGEIDELARLNQALEDLRSKQGPLLTERATLVSGIMGIGVKGVFDLDQKLGWLSKQAEGYQRQIDEIFKRLTNIPKLDFLFLNFLSLYEKSKS